MAKTDTGNSGNGTQHAEKMCMFHRQFNKKNRYKYWKSFEVFDNLAGVSA